MSTSVCGLLSERSNAGDCSGAIKMAGSNGSCSFIKQEQIDRDLYSGESRSNEAMDAYCHKGDLKDDVSKENASKSPSSSPPYQKLNSKNSGQLLQQQPDSQSSNNNSCSKNGELLHIRVT